MANTYTTYKDSGIPWIGEIPEHWQVCRIKNVATCNDDTLSETTSPYLPIEYVEIGDVNSSEGIVHTEFYSFKDAPSRARRITQKGDVIVSTVRTYLRAISKIDKNGLIVSTGFAVLRAVKYHADYLAYSALSESFINNVIAISTGISYPSVNATQISNLPILLPSQIEQESIANFLDGKCSEIDELISGVINYVGGTRKVDGYDAKISVKCGYAKYSEFMDIDRMFLEAERRLFEAK